MNPGDATDAPDGGAAIRLPPEQSSSYNCQDIPETGECRDDVALYCDRRTSSIVEKRCGARGLTCDASGGTAICVDGEGNEDTTVPTEGEHTTGEPCGDVTTSGECSQDGVLSFCSSFSNTLVVVDCADLEDTQCGEMPGGGGYYSCNPIGCPDELKYDDQCDGNVWKHCELNEDTHVHEVVETDCGETMQTCEIDIFDEGSCVAADPPPDTPTCETTDIVGTCVDNTLYYCYDNEIYSQDCSASSQMCGYDDGLGLYDCL